MNLMREQEICVCFFTEVLEISQPKISRHLAYLRNAELVTARRAGKWMYYRIVQPEDFHARQILQDTLEWLASQERMQKDYEKLKLLFASLSVPVTITRNLKLDILPETNISFDRQTEIETYLL